MDVSCNGGSDGVAAVNVTGGSGALVYNWTPLVGTGNSVSGLSAGAYSLIIVDTNGCSDTAVFTINQPTAMVLSVSANPAGCGLSDGWAEVTASGGAGGYTYLWLPSGITSDSISGLTAGGYQVAVMDQNGCVTTASVAVNSTSNLQCTLSTVDVDCAGNSTGAATVQASGGASPYSFAWSVGTSVDSIISGIAAGSYQVVITDAAGCSYTQLVIIREPDSLRLTVSSDTTVCSTQTATLRATVVGGTPPYSYMWSSGLGGSTLAVNPQSASDYSVYAVDARRCATVADTVHVDVYPQLQVNTATNDTVCPGTVVELAPLVTGGDGHYSFFWANGDTASSVTFVANQNSQYSVTVVDGCSNTVRRQMTFDLKFGPEAIFIPYAVIDCAPSAVEFSNFSIIQPGCTYRWDFGDQQTSDLSEPTHVYDTPGIYNVSLLVTATNGCVDSMVVPGLVSIYDAPVADFVQSNDEVSSLTPVVEFANTSIGGVFYEWDFGDGTRTDNSVNPTHMYRDTGTYEIRLITTSQIGCVDTITSIVKVYQGFAVYIPASFTPNGDYLNDYFRIYCVGVTRYDLYIFDRWGLEIFHSEDPEEVWDGTMNGNSGKLCPIDSYVFLLKLADEKGEPHEYRGRVTVIR
jgi:gliding motility-associated-like protein